jgi:hypothetical protein
MSKRDYVGILILVVAGAIVGAWWSEALPLPNDSIELGHGLSLDFAEVRRSLIVKLIKYTIVGAMVGSAAGLLWALYRKPIDTSRRQ